jgi:hypothetical protein
MLGLDDGEVLVESFEPVRVAGLEDVGGKSDDRIGPAVWKFR